MLLYECTLTFHDSLFYETRTLGRLYETGRLLHNIALCYALGLAQTSFYHERDVPAYADELAALNRAGIYVTPAAGINIQYVVNTFKFGAERTTQMMERSNANIPTYGRAKEVAVGSQFRFAVLSEQVRLFPKWIRMGLWLSKARLHVSPAVTLRGLQGDRTAVLSRYPVNPADLPAEADLRLYDLVSMRPSSLVENAQIAAENWWLGDLPLPDGSSVRIELPAGLYHQVG